MMLNLKKLMDDAKPRFRRPSYLRVVATTRCNYQCSYCHMEGDPHQSGSAYELDGQLLSDCLTVMARAGMAKIKFLGGEPLLRRDLPEVVTKLRAVAPQADLSIITAGAVPARLHQQLFEAGLDRINVSIHGFGPEAFALRNPNPKQHARRQDFLTSLLLTERPVKLNYVYSGPADDEDLMGLLRWASARRVLVNILNNLEDQALGPAHIMDWLIERFGHPNAATTDHDPHSLDTVHLSWSTGLKVEVKVLQLGTIKPWASCWSCPVQERCREGIFAMRLTHDGMLVPCMDRPDLGMALAATVKVCGVDYAAALVERYLDRLIYGFAQQQHA